MKFFFLRLNKLKKRLKKLSKLCIFLDQVIQRYSECSEYSEYSENAWRMLILRTKKTFRDATRLNNLMSTRKAS